MLQIDASLTAKTLLPALRRVFELSGQKIERLERRWNPAHGTPVFTVRGQYTTRGWTEWTQGFQFGSAILQFDASGEQRFLDIGRTATVERMASHLTHIGVHDHGFNNVSTYGNLLRLQREGRIPDDPWERRFYELALKVTGAVQAAPLHPPVARAGLHLLLQRPPLAVRRHDPLAAGAGGLAPAGPRASWARGTSRSAARAAAPARRGHRPLQRLLRRGARHLRRARAGRARVDLQPQRRRLPLPVEPAGLFALHHLDARAGLGPVRLSRAARVPGHAARRGLRRPGRSRQDPGALPGDGRGHRRLLHRQHARPTASPTGTPARPGWPSSATTWAGPPTRSTSTSRSTARPPPSPPRG